MLRNGEGGIYLEGQTPVGVERLEELERDAALWRQHKDNIWRLYVHLVVRHIATTAPYRVAQEVNFQVWLELNGDKTGTFEHLARAFVRAARENHLRLCDLVALVMQETRQSPFDNTLVGASGERTMVQILPFPGREHIIKDGLADPAVAIEWAGRYLANGYKMALPTLTEDGAIRFAFRRYNGGPGGMDSKAAHQYADEVMALGAAMVKDCELWAVVPQ